MKDSLNTDGVVPSFIDASPLVIKRLNQVSDLVDVGGPFTPISLLFDLGNQTWRP